MRAILNSISSTGSSDPVFSGGGRTRTLTVVRRPRARGMRLSVDRRDGKVKLTLAPRAPLRPALAWVAEKRDWVEGELARLPIAVPIVPGMAFDLGDGRVTLNWSTDLPRTPRLSSGVLAIGGSLEGLDARVLRFLRSHALGILTNETRELAAAHGIDVGRIGVGDARGRWGSCATSGDIRYSWRLILTPDHIRRATVAHEVAHRVHMNHGAAFHALAARLHGADPAPARAWFRAHGTALHWFGRTG